MSNVKPIKHISQTDITKIPALALRGLVIFPNNIIQFEVGRKKSIAAVDYAMAHGSALFLFTQKQMDIEDPALKDMYKTGVVAEVKQVLKVTDGLVKVLVDTKYRAKLLSLESEGSFLLASTKPYPLTKPRGEDPEQLEALVRAVKEKFERYIAVNSRLPKDIVFTVISSNDAAFLGDYIPGNLNFKVEDKQSLLEEKTLAARLTSLISILQKEINIISLEKELHNKVNEQMERNQRNYYLREEMRVISDELNDGEDPVQEAQGYQERILALKLPQDIEKKLLKEADRLSKMPGGTQESAVITTYLDACLELPWHTTTKDVIDIKKAATRLNKGHYGMEKVKDRILEILAVRKLAPDIKGQIICLVGPPGVGKTSIANSIAQCIGRNFARMSLGGVRDEAEIRGHRRTYVGAMPGKIINAVQTAGSKNPLILLDEIDKLASDFRGDPAAALLEALDPEQNSTFKDHYLDVPFDLSKVLFITTANSLDTIPRPLLDRMDVIELSSYTREEKFQIAKRHLLPKQLVNTGTKGLVKVSDSALYSLVDHYTREAGVRNLERAIAEVLRKCAIKVAQDDSVKITVNAQNLQDLLGPYRAKDSYSLKANAVGIANGLAWTSVGGELLPIEVQIIEGGSGKLQLTGSLGDVMKESAQLAITYAKVHADKYGIDAARFDKIDIHIHAPEGAVPKDGPSAGVTLSTALISALSGRPVRADVAMTGEITLHGSVLPIGGLREKAMAAYREKIKTVLIPADNVSDLYYVDDAVKKNVCFLPMSSISQVLSEALCPLDKSEGTKGFDPAVQPQSTGKTRNVRI